jgi:predicted permease
MWTSTFWEQFAQDVRYGLRMMTSNPLFTAMAALSLALGIGANTAIYSFMDAVLLRSLPVQRPEELVVFNWHTKDFPPIAHSFSGNNYKDPKTGFTSGNFPFPAFEILRANHDVCSSIFGFQNGARLNLIVQGQAEIADAQLVSGAYYAGLGIAPAAGRMIGDDDDRPGATPVAVISFGYWQRRFASSPAVVGQSILINNVPFTIVGVSAPEFYGVNPGAAPIIFIPIHDAPLFQTFLAGKPDTRFIEKNFYWVEMMGRLRPGVSLAQAQAALAAPFHQFVASTAVKEREKADLPALFLTEGSTGLDSLRRQFSKPLYVLMTLVGMILAIACANIANLLLARATARRREMAVRLSLGAGRARVVRQLLTESLLLASVGGLLGVIFAFWGVRFLSVLIASGRDNFALHADLNWHVLGFTLALSLGTGMLFGLAPAMQATGIDLTPALKETRSEALRRRARGSFVRVNLSQALVVLQVALSLLLLIAAGLFVRTLSNLQSVELGFNRENLLLFSMNAKQAGYKDAALAGFYHNLQNRLSAIPGVRGVSLSTYALVSGSMSSRGFKLADAAKTANKPQGPSMLTVGPHFFTTMQIPILLGREIDERDKAGSPLVSVVNQNLVNTYFGGENPIGQRFGFGNGTPGDIEIIGVARNARYNTLKKDIPPVIYIPYRQSLQDLNQMFFEVRTAGDPLAVVNTVRKIVQQADAHVPVINVRTQAGQIDQTLSQERIFAQLCSVFAVLALAIACVGLYGTMAYTVARRTSEIGIRMALGAQRRRIVWMVLREVSVMTAVGLAIGLPTAYGTTQFVKSFLFGMQPNDPLALSLAVVVLLAAAILAGYAPARRASKIDPMVALRHE